MESQKTIIYLKNLLIIKIYQRKTSIEKRITKNNKEIKEIIENPILSFIFNHDSIV